MASWFVPPIVFPLILVVGYALYRYRAYMLQMRGPTATPHSVFSLQKSNFNDSELPSGRWAQPATGIIAARLIALLPAKRASVTQVRETTHGKHPVSARMVMCLFIVFFNVLVFSVIRNHEPQPAVDQSSSASSSADSPQVPLADSK
jgi:hypothetical protein